MGILRGSSAMTLQSKPEAAQGAMFNAGYPLAFQPLRHKHCANLARAVRAMLPAGQQRQLRPCQQVLHNEQPC